MARSALRFILALVLSAGSGSALDVSVTGFIPINDLGLRLYLNQFQGGLYPNGSNQVPAAHLLAGLAADGIVNHTTLAIVDSAMGGQAANVWVSPSASNYNRVRDEQLTPLGLTEAQVQAIWLKQADIQPTVALPNTNADAYVLERALIDP